MIFLNLRIRINLQYKAIAKNNQKLKSEIFFGRQEKNKPFNVLWYVRGSILLDSPFTFMNSLRKALQTIMSLVGEFVAHDPTGSASLYEHYGSL